MFAAECQEKPAAKLLDITGGRGQMFRQLVVADRGIDCHRRECMDPRPLEEIDQRLFLERLDLWAGRQNRCRTSARTGAVGDRFLQWPRQNQQSVGYWFLL